MFNDQTIALVLTALLALLGFFAGTVVGFSKGRKLLKEVGDVLVTVAKAAEDMKFSAEEIAAIKKEAGEAIEAFKELRKKPDAEPEPGG